MMLGYGGMAGRAHADEITITNLAASQCPGTKLMDITYDLVGGGGSYADVTLSAIYKPWPGMVLIPGGTNAETDFGAYSLTVDSLWMLRM